MDLTNHEKMKLRKRLTSKISVSISKLNAGILESKNRYQNVEISRMSGVRVNRISEYKKCSKIISEEDIKRFSNTKMKGRDGEILNMVKLAYGMLLTDSELEYILTLK